MKVTHIISNKAWGGGEQYVLDLCCQLIHDSNKVSILVRPVDAVIDKLSGLEAKICKLSFANLLRIDADVVHVHNFKDARKVAIARLLSGKNYRIVVTRHLIRPAKTGWLDTWLYRQIDRLIFVSQLARDTFLSTSPSIDNRKINVVHNSISLVSSDKAITLPTESAITLMYHGRVAEEKGLDTLMDALPRLGKMDFHLYIIGTGAAEYTNHLKVMIQRYDLDNRVTFLGFKENIADYVSKADIGVIPTIAQEACGLSCMEYMAAGKCVITTNNGGQKEYIHSGKNGILIPPQDSVALAEAILDVVKEKKYEDIGRQAAIDFENSMSYSSFYDKIIKNYK